MKNTSQFIQRAMRRCQSLNLIHALVSSFPLYLAAGLLLIPVGAFAAGSAGFRGLTWIVVFLLILAGIAYLWVKLYQHYELRSPVKKRVFDCRLAAFLETTRLKPVLTRIRRKDLKAELTLNGKPCPVSLKYSQNILMNIGGIVPGTPMSLAILRPINPRTWFLQIRGDSTLLSERRICFDFSARNKDKDPMGGKGLRIYDMETEKSIKKPDPELEEVSEALKKTIKDTFLKGTLECDRGGITLTLFDTMTGIHKWSRQVIRFSPATSAPPGSNGEISDRHAAFKGADALITLGLGS